ncbi:MAG: TonB-dependent receptor, partial [Candidatus Eremiobacteraeota bacterium]|nr:TonB-dependent receptor [Candidatus Eremiobacteraeota bacterium]
QIPSSNNPGENFWAAAAQREFCYNTTSLAYTGVHATCAAGSAHPDGVGGDLLYSNTYPKSYAPTEWEPRVAATYTLDPNTVLRASMATSAQPPNTASIQYLTSQPNTPGYFFSKFIAVGYVEPFHNVRPAVANNFDFSLERRVGSDLAFKLTPYARYTRDYLQDVFIDQATQYVSAINSGNTKAYGVEFQAQKGDFNRDGFAALFNYTYTNVKIRYTNLGNSSVNSIDQINAAFGTFNGFTKAGGGSPCYSNTTTGTGAATSCSDPTAIVNPYYNMSPQAPLDRNGYYEPFLFTQSVPGAGPVSIYAPHVASLILNYKKQRWAVTPSFQLIAGQKYGTPLNQYGWDPTTCAQNQAGVPSAVAAGRGQYADYTSCGGSLLIPNPDTGVFDGMGAFTEPAQVIGNLQFSYDLTPKTTLQLSLVNALNTCFGGSKGSWTVGGNKACAYGVDNYTGEAGVGNFYNGASPTDVAANGILPPAQFLHSYYPVPGSFIQPFQVYLNLKLRI